MDRLGIRWDVREDPATICYSSKSARKPSDSRLKGPATVPAIAAMHITIVRGSLPWTINVPVDAGGIISVEKVLGAIYACLQKPLTQAEWDKLEGSKRRKNAHVARLNRLLKGAVAFELDPKLKRVDLLGECVMYDGLKPAEPYDAPKEWVLTLKMAPELASALFLLSRYQL
ncbi:hypothetical protein BU17DRAFT_48870 [Hysterangium stoloniferum]|nr:hypothetical protein BU17DRAFT_48870 [Hysterangium stoloniferum]